MEEGAMNGKRAPALLLLCLVSTLSMASACAPAEAPAAGGETPEGVNLTFVGIAAGSSMQLKADAIAESVRLEHPEWTVTSMASGGEARLIEKRIAGEADFYFSTSFRDLEVSVFAPLHPDLDFEAATAYSIVMPSSRAYVQMFALGQTGLTVPADIVERKYPFTLGCGAGIMRTLFGRILEYYGAGLEESEAWGAKYETMIATSPESVESLQAGRTDMGFTFGSMPSPALLGATFKLRYLPLSDPVPAVIPMSMYSFLTADVPTVMTTESLVARPDIPDDVVYQVCAAIFAHLDVLAAAHPSATVLLTPEDIASAVALAERNNEPYHPGALRYYRDRGWI
jgi:hypothetical protein